MTLRPCEAFCSAGDEENDITANTGKLFLYIYYAEMYLVFSYRALNENNLELNGFFFWEQET